MPDVHLLCHDLDADPRDDDALEALLDAAERERASKFVFPWLSRRYRVGRAVLRSVLGHWTGVPPASLVLATGPQGKPSLQHGPAFNMSHAEGKLLLSVSTTGRLGVDLELARSVDDLVAMARANFADDEIGAVLAAPPGLRHRVFLEVWTRKEAIIKALGGGLSIPLPAFSVLSGRGSGSLLKRLDLEGERVSEWCLQSIDEIPGCPDGIAAVALDTADFAVEWLPPELAFT